MTIAPSNNTSIDNKLEEWLEQLKTDSGLTLSYLLSKLKELWYKSSLQPLGDWSIVDNRLLLSLPSRRELIYFTINLEQKEIKVTINTLASITVIPVLKLTQTIKLNQLETFTATIVEFLQKYLESDLNEQI